MKTFPIRPDPRFPFPIDVPWSLAEQAYAHWEPDFGAHLSLDQIAKRGGWGVVEFSCNLLDAPEVIPEAELSGYVERARDQVVAAVTHKDRDSKLPKERFDQLRHRSGYGESIARLLKAGKPLEGKALSYAIEYALSLHPTLCELQRVYKLLDQLLVCTENCASKPGGTLLCRACVIRRQEPVLRVEALDAETP